MALACAVAGITPREFLTMGRLERDLLVQSASQLEKWRWEQLATILGG